jgi:hypothetical protein
VAVRRRLLHEAGEAAARGGEGRTVPLLGGGRVELARDVLTADFVTPEALDDDDLAHPYLASAASVMAAWQGWTVFHAGAFAAGGAAVAVLGRREEGKSTLLAAVALAGVDVVADDLLVVDGSTVHVGPRCVDLRLPGARAAFPDATLDPSRSGERARLALPVLASAPELAGWVALGWGERLELRSLRPSERLRRLASSRIGAGSGEAILDLARLPGWELTRPRRFDLLPDTVERLVRLTAG